MAELQTSQVVLVVLDVINPLNAEGAEGLLEAARRAAPKILALRERAHEADVPVVYVNGAFGQAQADFAELVASFSETELPGHTVTRMLAPTERDDCLIKASDSAFSCITFEPRLRQLGARTLVLTGFTTDGALRATADDAHARGYDVLVPADCTAATSVELGDRTLERLRVTAHASADDSLEIDLAALRYAVA